MQTNLDIFPWYIITASKLLGVGFTPVLHVYIASVDRTLPNFTKKKAVRIEISKKLLQQCTNQRRNIFTIKPFP